MKKITEKQRIKNKEKKEENIRMFNFFRLIWNKRKHESEVSGEYLGKEPLSIYFHHILPKERCPEARYDEENIILLTFDEHQKVENNPYSFPVINEIREKLMIKYDRYN